MRRATSATAPAAKKKPAPPRPALDELLVCAVCTELFDVPVVDKCGHVFCAACVWRGAAAKEEDFEEFACPLCQGEFLTSLGFDQGADIRARDVKHETAMDYAKNYNQPGAGLALFEHDPYAFEDADAMMRSFLFRPFL